MRMRLWFNWFWLASSHFTCYSLFVAVVVVIAAFDYWQLVSVLLLPLTAYHYHAWLHAANKFVLTAKRCRRSKVWKRQCTGARSRSIYINLCMLVAIVEYISASGIRSARKPNSFIEIKVARLHMRAIAERRFEIALVLFYYILFYFLHIFICFLTYSHRAPSCA